MAIESEGKIIPKIKISENVDKITIPGFKQVYRLYDKTSGKATADVISLHDEIIDESKPYQIFHPLYTWKKKTLTNFTARKLLIKIFDKGNCVYESPNIKDIQKYCKEQISTLWDEVLRFENPHEYFVDLSDILWNIKTDLLRKYE